MEKQSWIVTEVHGAWWAYFGPPQPEDKYFFSHGRPHAPRIIGPYYSKDYAEMKAAEISKGKAIK